eukprot:6201376-Pleurochrysis_carterae.AAC.5
MDARSPVEVSNVSVNMSLLTESGGEGHDGDGDSVAVVVVVVEEEAMAVDGAVVSLASEFASESVCFFMLVLVVVVGAKAAMSLVAAMVACATSCIGV